LSRDYVHLIADFLGVPAAQLGDNALVSGLLIAAAGAAGVNASEMPTLRIRHSGGLTAALLQDECHITVHSFPERELLLVDVLVPRGVDGALALDVFARRLTAREIKRDSRERG
jgi:S-adenosylmethionine/arginine decarboxylase-like enzyme